MKLFSRYSLLIALALVVNSAFCVNYNIRSVGVNDGLSQSDVIYIHQDQKGLMWISTNGGLNTYDGLGFEQVNVDKSGRIYAPHYRHIEQAPNGELWICIADNIVIYDVAHDRSYLLRDVVNYRDFNYPRVKFLANGDAIVYEGTSLHIFSYNKQDNSYSYRKDLDMGAQVMDVITNTPYHTMIATRSGAYSLINDTLKLIHRGNIAQFRLLNGVLYALSHDGVYIYDGSKFNKHIRANISNITMTDNLYWYSSNRGLYVVEADENGVLGRENPQQILYDLEIHHITTDRNGQVWVGTNEGVKIINTRSIIFDSIIYDKSLFSNNVRSIHEDGDSNLWVGSHRKGAGLIFIPKNRYEQAIPIELPSSVGNIHSICNVGRDIYMVSDQLIKVRWNGNYNKPKFFTRLITHPTVKNNIMVCSVDPKEESLWLGYFDEGIYRYHIAEDRFEKIPLNIASTYDSHLYVRNIRFDPKGNMWIGTSLGLYIMSAKQIESKEYKLNQYHYDSSVKGAISNNYIVPILFDDDGYAWVGTLGGGLYRTKLDCNGLPTTFKTIKRGFLNPYIKSLERDRDGAVWISTNRGINKYNPRDSTLCSYGNSNGVMGSEFGELASASRRSGELLFGSRDGLNIVDNSNIGVDNQSTQIYIKSLSLYNKIVNIGEKVNGRVLLDGHIDNCSHITLRHNENHFTLDFVSLHYVDPKLNRYRYKLEGFDSEWIEGDIQFSKATYNNMNPGEYTFRVETSNSDSSRGGERRVAITILNPWWNTPYALTTFLFLAIALVFVLYRYNLLRMRQLNQIRLAKVESQRMQDMSQMQTNFFTNISHEFRTPLSLIIAPTADLTSSNALTEDDRKRVKLIDYNANILLRLINQLLDFTRFNQGKLSAKPEVRDMVSFLNRLLEQFTEFAKLSSIEISFESEPEELICRIDYTMLEHILYNLLSNSLKNTDADGVVRMSLDCSDSNILIKVADTGCGIPPEVEKNLFERFVKGEKGGTGIGLNFTKNLVELNGGEISYITSGEGTTFAVSFPSVVVENENGILKITPPDSVSPLLSDNYDLKEDEDTTERAKMLIVEDNSSMLEYLTGHFCDRYSIITAVNGEIGLRKATALVPDIIISDVVMPKLCGDQMCRMIKENPTTSHIPVVLLTAKTSSADQAEGYRCGADIYCAKPFEVSVLDAAINSLVETRNMLQERFKYMDTQVSDLVTNNSDEVLMGRAVRFIKKNITDCDLTIGQVAEHINLSNYLFNKKLKALTGVSGNTFIRNIRLKYAADLLLKSNNNVSEVIYASGFNNLKYFRRCFSEMFGVTPSEYRRLNK